MTERDEREKAESADDELKLPEAAVEDLEVDDDDATDVKGAYALKQGFPVKWP